MLLEDSTHFFYRNLYSTGVILRGFDPFFIKKLKFHWCDVRGFDPFFSTETYIGVILQDLTQFFLIEN